MKYAIEKIVQTADLHDSETNFYDSETVFYDSETVFYDSETVFYDSETGFCDSEDWITTIQSTVFRNCYPSSRQQSAP